MPKLSSGLRTRAVASLTQVRALARAITSVLIVGESAQPVCTLDRICVSAKSSTPIGIRQVQFCVADGRRRVDAIGPAEHILHRQQQQIGAGVVRLGQQRVADGRRRSPRRADAARPSAPSSVAVRRSSSISHQSASGSMSCVLVVTTDAGGNVAGIEQGLPCSMPVAFPSQHLVARHLHREQRLAHEVGDRAEVFGGDLRAVLDEQLRMRSPCARCSALRPSGSNAPGASPRPREYVRKNPTR